MENADRFLIVTGFIMSRLYKKIPWSTIIDFDEISDLFVTREENDVMPWQDAFVATVKWLSDSDCLCSDYRESKGTTFKLRLSAKLLCSLIAFTDTSTPKVIGDILVEAAEAGDHEKLKNYGRAVLIASSKAS